jgi:scyllo-inositol 2-dehydrogenase (NADP+)
MVEKFKVAVIGTGKMGLLHASILSTLPNIELVALCDKSSFIRKFSQKLLKGVQSVSDLEKVIALNPDIVYVTTPIPSHYSVISSLCSNGEMPYLFVEKTLSSRYSDSVKLCELSQKFKKTNMVGYMKRFAVTFNKAKELLDQQAIGQINSFVAYAFSSDFFGLEESMQTSRGGVISDLGSHAIDTALWLFSEFEVAADSENMITKDVANFTVETSKGIKGKFEISWSKEGYHMPEIGLIISGEGGKIRVNDDLVQLQSNTEQTRSWYRHDLQDNVGFLLGGPEYYRENVYFIKSITEKLQVETDFTSASKVDYIIEKVSERAGNIAKKSK